MSEIIETYQQEQEQLAKPELPQMALATVVQKTNDGLQLVFDGEETANTKSYPYNPNGSYSEGQRVLAAKINGQYVVLCPVARDTETPSLSSISIQSPPSKTEYLDGDAFDPAGMIVRAHYSNGAAMPVSGYTYTPTTLTDGTTQVTIQYRNHTTAQEVSVEHRLTAIQIATMPSKTSYECGESFDPSGMVVKATYSDGAQENVSDYVLAPTVFEQIGEQSVTVSYTERGVTKTATLSVTVTRVTIAAVPTQSGSLTYNGGEQTPVWSGYDETQMTIGGVTEATNAGSYSAAFTPGSIYQWPDGTTEPKTVAWSIAKAAGSLSIFPTRITLDPGTQSAEIEIAYVGDGVLSVESSDTDIAAVSVSGTTATVSKVGSGSASVTFTATAGQNFTAPDPVQCSVSVLAYFAAFSDNTWEQIIDACQNDNVPATWQVGNSKPMMIGGTSYAVDIIGIRHDTYRAGGTAPLTFQLHDCLSNVRQMNSTDTNRLGWGGSAMISYLNSSLIQDLPSAVGNALQYVKKLTSAGSTSSTINTTNQKLFLLSEVEVGSSGNAYPGEGTRYAYYNNHSRIKTLSGNPAPWWLRSPRRSDSKSFCLINTGGISGYRNASMANGVSFAFCF